MQSMKGVCKYVSIELQDYCKGLIWTPYELGTIIWAKAEFCSCSARTKQ
jgi:hypothetical protein